VAAVALVMLTTLLLLCVAAPLLPLPHPNATMLPERLLPPLSSGHWLGTDQLGRDVLSRLLYGARLSLGVATLGVCVAAGVGSLVGLLTGYYEGLLDNVVMRGVDVLMAFPYLLLALAIVVVLGPGLENATLAIAIVNVPFFARTVRGQTLSLKREPFVDAARVSGLGDATILASELLPALSSTIVVAASTSLGWMLLETAGLSFLGLGAQPPTADLGGMLGQGRHLLATAPHVSLVPGAFIFVVVALLNVLGDGLRDALDPRHDAARPATEPEAAASELDLERTEVPDRLLSVQQLSVRFDDFTAVHDVSFSLAAGETLGLVGESGSGKSVTALSLLALLEPPGRISKGKLRFDGLDLAAIDPAELLKLRGGRIAWIPQDPMTSLHPLLRIGRQLGEALELHQNLSGGDARRRARELLEEVDIAGASAVLDAYPHQLSGGMRQRVSIAMALSGDPELLIADEPTTALDVTTQAGVLECLQRLTKQRNLALLFISHDLAVVSQLCDRVLVLQRGRVVERGQVASVVASPSHPYTRHLLRSVPELGNPAHILEGEDRP
jgi:peptide/nickel transport system permease protein